MVDITTRCSIEDYLAQCSPPHYPAQRFGPNYMYICPIRSERTPSFKVATGHQLWYCHGCHEGGSAPYLVHLLEGCSWPDAYKRLGMPVTRLQQRTLPPRTGQQVATDQQQVVMLFAMGWWHERLWASSVEARIARRYLLSRGISVETLKRVEIGYAPLDPDGTYAQGLRQHLARALGKGWDTDGQVGIATGLFVKDGSGKLRNQARVMFSCGDNVGAIRYYQGRQLPLSQNQGQAKRAKYMGPPLAKYPFWLKVARPLIEATVGVESPMGSAVLAGYSIPHIATLGNDTLSWSTLKLFPSPFLWAQDNDAPRAEGRQPGEEQAQASLAVCKQLGVAAYRLRPPRLEEEQSVGIDEWVAREGIYPVIQEICEITPHVPLALPISCKNAV